MGGDLNLMVDISDPEFVWGELLFRIRVDDHPTPKELAARVERALEEGGAPEAVWKYVGRRIRDEENLGHGGRPVADAYERWAKRLNLQLDVMLREAAFRRQKVGAPKTRALCIVANWARENGKSITVHRLRSKLRSLKDAPAYIREYMRSEDEVQAMLEKMLADGTADLDPDKGLVWL